MQDEMSAKDLRERLGLIENMIAEGRRRTESWGWSFVLWGVAYYVAIGWSTWGHSTWAWPVTMVAASVLTGILASRVTHKGAETTIGRAMAAIWIAMGMSLFVVLFCLSLSGRADLHIFVAIVGGLLGAANAISSMILKWKMQFACAVVWLATAGVSCFISETQASVVFLVAIFFCQIVFGFYGMIGESRRRKQDAAHA
ncbi:MAG: hypothetical protein WBV28_21440 [Terracidiphilus sp.]